NQKKQKTKNKTKNVTHTQKRKRCDRFTTNTQKSSKLNTHDGNGMGRIRAFRQTHHREQDNFVHPGVRPISYTRVYESVRTPGSENRVYELIPDRVYELIPRPGGRTEP